MIITAVSSVGLFYLERGTLVLEMSLKFQGIHRPCTLALCVQCIIHQDNGAAQDHVVFVGH